MSSLWTLGAVWFGVVFGLVAATHQLLRWAGILVASQGAMVLVGAGIFALLARFGASPIAAGAVTVVACTLIGVLHRYVLYVAGPLLFVLLCLAGDIFLAELWLAAPGITGGSGGLLLPERAPWLGVAAAAAAVGLAAVVRYGVGSRRSFPWATIRAHGWHSGLFGVDDRQLMRILFGAYGACSGFAGVAIAANAGYVAPQGLQLSFTIAIVMIATAVSATGNTALVGLSLVYVSLRTVVRQSVLASALAAAIFEVLFPVVLMVVVMIRVLRSRGPRVLTLDGVVR